MQIKYGLTCLLLTLSLTACQSDEPTSPSSPDNSTGNTNTTPADTLPANYVECKDPRPEVCTREYKPVCARKDNGIRCVTTPCPSTDKVTASNACTACSDKAVLGYTPDGACPAE